jgi:hypothetical protein
MAWRQRGATWRHGGVVHLLDTFAEANRRGYLKQHEGPKRRPEGEVNGSLKFLPKYLASVPNSNTLMTMTLEKGGCSLRT